MVIHMIFFPLILPLIVNLTNNTLCNATDDYSNDKLKCLSLNYCSLRSVIKKTSFLALIDEHKPDIICECESHLDNSYFTVEFFLSNYIILRKDRVEDAGGVFICVEINLNMSELPELNTNAELIWANLR